MLIISTVTFSVDGTLKEIVTASVNGLGYAVSAIPFLSSSVDVGMEFTVESLSGDDCVAGDDPVVVQGPIDAVNVLPVCA